MQPMPMPMPVHAGAGQVIAVLDDGVAVRALQQQAPHHQLVGDEQGGEVAVLLPDGGL